MKWLPSWLGEAYCTLYSRLKEDFTVDDASNVLNVPKDKAALITSRLSRAGWLDRIGKGRYRALKPRRIIEQVSMYKEIDRNLASVPQREFVPPLRRFMQLALKQYGERLISAVVFGSLARGDATPTSDIDLLLVTKGLPPRLMERYDEITEPGLSPPARRARGEPLAPISPVLYTPQEASDFHNIYLDMTRHAIILLDRGGFICRKLDEVSRQLEELDSKRLELEGKPVWMLKPDLQRGEVVELG